MTKGKIGVRIAAVGDVHVNDKTAAEWRSLLQCVAERADILVLCGDLTNRGLAREAEVLVEELSHVRLTTIGILGNHDYECGEQDEVVRVLCAGGVMMLDQEPYEVQDIGFAGVKGFCGGFDRHELAPFGEPSIKTFVHESVEEAIRLESALSRLRTKEKIAVLHYAPIPETVVGEPEQIFPFLGSSRLAPPLDRYEVTACVHGHAHRGTFEGATPKGIPVYNVALPLMRERDAAEPFLVLDL